jgi:hypothetical protein
VRNTSQRSWMKWWHMGQPVRTLEGWQPGDRTVPWLFTMIYLTVIGLTPAGSSTVHIYTQTAHRTT